MEKQNKQQDMTVQEAIQIAKEGGSVTVHNGEVKVTRLDMGKFTPRRGKNV